MITSVEFMQFFRSDAYSELTPDDGVEIFQSCLKGAADITKELIMGVAMEYDVDILGLFSIAELQAEIELRTA